MSHWPFNDGFLRKSHVLDLPSPDLGVTLSEPSGFTTKV